MEITDVEALSPRSSEIPRRVETISLPDIDILGTKVKLGMHTDTTLTLVRTLAGLPDVDELRIEGRILTKEQVEKLIDHPAYRFFLASRLTRAQQGGELGITIPSDIGLTQEEVARMLQSPYTPSTLSSEIGFETGFFTASDLVDLWKEKFGVSDIMPLIAGINQFEIGSDTLSSERLREIAQVIDVAFYEQTSSAAIPTFSPQNLTPFTTYILSSVLGVGSTQNYYPIIEKSLPDKFFNKVIESKFNENIITRSTKNTKFEDEKF